MSRLSRLVKSIPHRSRQLIQSLMQYPWKERWLEIAPGRHRRYCPLCEQYSRRFGFFGDPPRKEAVCLKCRSLERHRLVWLYFHQKTNLFAPETKRLLHIAPEKQLSNRLKADPSIDYLSVDLQMPHAMRHMDITQLELEAQTFDAVYCSHVLEHIPDDRRALHEIYRVLSPGGWAILQVPMSSEPTYEDPAITSPDERKHHFGQHNHVRLYGPDYKDRLEEVGFQVNVDDFVTRLSSRTRRKLRLDPKEMIYFCQKPQ